MSLFRTLASLDGQDNLHLARLLLLLRAFAGRQGTETVDGLTKLAKLDFLLRYPTYLERAVRARAGQDATVTIAEHERLSVESKMVRYKYGPWDFRYRRFVNLLVAKSMAQVAVEGRTICVGLTPIGKLAADKLAESEAFADVVERAQILKRHFDLSATTLMKFVYETFPEISGMKLGQEIDR